MRTSFLQAIAATLAVLAIGASARADDLKVSKLRVAPEKIGADWAAAPGIVVDDLEAPPAEKATAEIVTGLKKQVRPLGVRGLADFTYRHKTDRNRQVTARVFVFDTPEKCQEWIKTKYQFAGWEEKYKRVEDKDRMTFDSLEIPKRIVATDKILITCGTIGEKDDHLPVLKLILANLQEQTEASKQDAKEPKPADPDAAQSADK